jgi:hypothetical protein
MIRPRSPQRRRTCLGQAFLPAISAAAVACIASVLLLPALPVPSFAATWRFEAESVSPAHRHDTGGDSIHVVSCSAASGGHALEGLDAPGDWAEFDVTFAVPTCFTDSLRCASPTGVFWQFHVEFYAEGSPDPVAGNEHNSIVGRGIT